MNDTIARSFEPSVHLPHAKVDQHCLFDQLFQQVEVRLFQFLAKDLQATAVPTAHIGVFSWQVLVFVPGVVLLIKFPDLLRAVAIEFSDLSKYVLNSPDLAGYLRAAMIAGGGCISGVHRLSDFVTDPTELRRAIRNRQPSVIERRGEHITYVTNLFGNRLPARVGIPDPIDLFRPSNESVLKGDSSAGFHRTQLMPDEDGTNRRYKKSCNTSDQCLIPVQPEFRTPDGIRRFDSSAANGNMTLCMHPPKCARCKGDKRSDYAGDGDGLLHYSPWRLGISQAPALVEVVA